MNLKSNVEWKEWGRRDPLFGVASWRNKNVGGAAPWTDEEFYALGASDWKDFEAHWGKYGYQAGTFLEIGCGAGRITKQLSFAFERGHAIDVSREMISYASRNVTTDNVEWHETQGFTIPLDDRTVDAVFSCHVLQHLPSPEAGYQYFREIMRTLKPGGTLMIHLPIHVFPVGVSDKFASLCDFLYRRVVQMLEVKSDYQRVKMKVGGRPPMHGVSYDQGQLYHTLLEMGYERVEFVTFSTASNGNLHSFVMATKPGFCSA